MGDMVAARKRRTANILQNSEDRMKKLLGYKQLGNNHASDTNSTKADDHTNGDGNEILSMSEVFRENLDKFNLKDIISSSSSTNNFSSNNSTDPSQIITEVPSLTPTLEKEEIIEPSVKENSKLRFFVMFVAGILIRLILESSLNVLIFKENVIYQFIILEVIMNISHKKQKQDGGSGMDYFIMSQILTFLGVTRTLSKSLLSVYSFWRTITRDFCVFMFTFLFTHYFCSLFSV